MIGARPRIAPLRVVALACVALAACRAGGGSDVVVAPDAAPAQGGERLIELAGAPDGERAGLERAIDALARDFRASGKRSYVDDAAYEAELYLRSQGYAEARVDYAMLPSGSARLEVAAGPRSLLGEVRVELDGSSPIAAEDLARYVNGPRTGLFGQGPMLYVARRVQRAAEAVRGDLVAVGHLDATASVQDPGPSAEGGPVQVVLRVAPGPAYTTGTVRFELERTSAALSAEAQAEVDRAIERVVGSLDGERRFRPRLVGTLRGAVTEAMGDHGHPDALVEVTQRIDRAAHRVDLDLLATPGPYVQLGDVEVEGEVRTRASFLRSRMRLERGDEYDASRLRQSLRGLYRTGLFRQVTARLLGDGEMRSVLVNVIERPSIELYAEPGWGSYEQARLTLGARDRNLFGRGIGASAEATVAVRALRANLGLTDPWFLRQELIGDLRLEFSRREEPSFTRENRGVGAFVTKEWTRQHASTVGYRFNRSSAEDVQAVDDDVLEVQSRVNVAGVILTQRYDARNALFAPTSGGFAEASVELAAAGLGSELEFLRSRVTSAWFAPLGEGDVLGLGMHLGVIAPAFDETTIPLQERFFAGGENSVRSFLESRLGPRDAAGEPLGGEAFGSLSLEWRRELAGAFQSALFVDAGFVEEQAEDLFALKDVRTGVGVGLRYLLPIGPLRIDAAFNPDRQAGEDEWVVHFAIGMPF